jgi:hypothetical protein
MYQTPKNAGSSSSSTGSTTSHESFSQLAAQATRESPEVRATCRPPSTDQLRISASFLPREESRLEVMEDPLEGLSRLARKLHTLWLACTYPFASIGKDVSVHYSCDLQRSRARYITIGDRVILGREVWLNIPNVSICNKSAIIIEEGCGIGRSSVISAKNQIHIQRIPFLVLPSSLWITITRSRM